MSGITRHRGRTQPIVANGRPYLAEMFGLAFEDGKFDAVIPRALDVREQWKVVLGRHASSITAC